MNWYIEAWKKYAVFSGRACRREFWCFILFNIVVYFLLTVIAGFLQRVSPGVSVGLLSLFHLAVLIPGVAVSVRRLHDTNHSGWWVLIGLVPVVGPFVLLIFMLQDSQTEENQYGPNPKPIQPGSLESIASA